MPIQAGSSPTEVLSSTRAPLIGFSSWAELLPGPCRKFGRFKAIWCCCDQASTTAAIALHRAPG